MASPRDETEVPLVPEAKQHITPDARGELEVDQDHRLADDDADLVLGE